MPKILEVGLPTDYGRLYVRYNADEAAKPGIHLETHPNGKVTLVIWWRSIRKGQGFFSEGMVKFLYDKDKKVFVEVSKRVRGYGYIHVKLVTGRTTWVLFEHNKKRE